jgi:N-acetylglucosamine malate deacetylase 2
MSGMPDLAGPDPLVPAVTLLEQICSPEGETLDCRDVMIVVAHPDDETIALGGQLRRMEGVRLLLMTDGAPLNMTDARAGGFATCEAYGRARRGEMETALAMAGVKRDALITFGLPDQSLASHLAELAERLANLLHEIGVATVLTHAYEGGHPDHDATAFIVRAACLLVERRDLPAPVVYEFPLYHARHGQMVAQEFAPGGSVEYAIALDEEAAEIKQRMLAAYSTQQRTLASFAAKTERFRPALPCDFGELPNGGDVLYSQYEWGLKPADWPGLIEKARMEMDLPRCL